MDSKETTVWKGHPSQVLNLKTFILCTLFCWLFFPRAILGDPLLPRGKFLLDTLVLLPVVM